MECIDLKSFTHILTTRPLLYTHPWCRCAFILNFLHKYGVSLSLDTISTWVDEIEITTSSRYGGVCMSCFLYFTTLFIMASILFLQVKRVVYTM
jgi:hypothetical protein